MVAWHIECRADFLWRAEVSRMRRHHRYLEHIHAAKWVKHVLQIILPAGNVHASLDQLLDSSNPSAFRMAIFPALDHQVDRCIGHNVQGSLLYFFNDAFCHGIIPGGLGAAVTGCDPPLPALLNRLLSEQFKTCLLYP